MSHFKKVPLPTCEHDVPAEMYCERCEEEPATVEDAGGVPLDQFWRDVGEWADATFGSQDANGKIAHHPQNCSDQDKAQTEAAARKLLGHQVGDGSRRIIDRGRIKVLQKRASNGHWYDQYPTGLTKYNLDDIYGDDLSLINTRIPRNDDDSPVAGAAA